MAKHPRKSDELLRVVFENDRNEVSAELLIGSLMHTSSILHAINRELGEEKEIDIKIKAFEQGSFQVVIELVERAVCSLFSSESVSYAASITTVATGVYGLVKHLRGKRPKSVKSQGDRVTIINHDGDVYNVDQRSYQIFNRNPEVRKQAQKQFEELEQYSDVTGFRFEGSGEVIRADRMEFRAMGQSIPTIDDVPEPQVRLIEDARLLILRPSFDPKLPWDFLYDGRKISARVTDESIWRIIDGGESFSKGSRMLVDLEETRNYDPEFGEFVLGRDSYHVQRFKRHLPAEHSANLFEED